MTSYSVGDRVVFAGETLTVVGVDGEMAVCRWFTVGLELRSATLPIAALTPARRGPSRDSDKIPFRPFGHRSEQGAPTWPANP